MTQLQSKSIFNCLKHIGSLKIVKIVFHILDKGQQILDSTFSCCKVQQGINFSNTDRGWSRYICCGRLLQYTHAFGQFLWIFGHYESAIYHVKRPWKEGSIYEKCSYVSVSWWVNKFGESIWNKQTTWTQTVLVAIASKYSAMFQLIDKKSKHGLSALDVAVENRRAKAVQLCLQYGQ